MATRFSITARDSRSKARSGTIHTAHGDVQTPCFMPIATVGAVHHVAPDELREIGATVVLANTYHLALRPGTAYLAERGGLHRFMGWDGPILTDSGGFQVFSLGPHVVSRGGKSLVEVSEEGVRFRSHVDGREMLFTPENVIDHQRNIGSDIAMVLDVCPPQPCPPDILREAVRRTGAWAQRSIVYAEQTGFRDRALLFGIVQGGADAALRAESAAMISALPFDGLAIGGVAVGEEKSVMRAVVEVSTPLLPDDRPRYLMGVGTPDDIAHAVAQGIDLFDCVLPTRDARHGRVYRWTDRTAFPVGNWYETINIGNERWRTIDEPIDKNCRCPTCQMASLAYLRHLCAIGEPLGSRFLTLHNLFFYFDFMRAFRGRIISPVS
ncbi:MAG: tRNA guanosine(34) transglycosylase Tgt [Candidatus Uhrbacteria bacterium]